jgi:hypothetical protein
MDGFRTVSKQRHPRMKCSILSSFSLHSKQVASVSVLYIRILLLCSIYDPLKEAISYLDEPESKTKWTRTVKEAVYKKWVDKITSLIPLYKGLTFLTFENLEKGLPKVNITLF